MRLTSSICKSNFGEYLVELVVNVLLCEGRYIRGKQAERPRRDSNNVWSGLDELRMASSPAASDESRDTTQAAGDVENGSVAEYQWKRDRPTRRQGAMKHKRAMEIKKHEFVRRFFKTPTFCALCKEFMW